MVKYFIAGIIPSREYTGLIGISEFSVHYITASIVQSFDFQSNKEMITFFYYSDLLLIRLSHPTCGFLYLCMK